MLKPFAQMLGSQGAPFFLIWVWARFALDLGDDGLDLLRRFVAPGGEYRGISPLLFEQVRFHVRITVRRIVPDAMPQHSL